MAKLAKWILGLNVGLVVAVAGAMLLGSKQESHLEILHLGDCQLPCWIGIVPGKTPISEGKAYIRAVYGSSYVVTDDDYSISIQDSSEQKLNLRIVFFTFSAQHVGLIDGIELQYKLPIGDLLAQLPRPSSVVPWGMGGGTFPTLIYDKIGVTATLEDNWADQSNKCLVISGHETVTTIDIGNSLPESWGYETPQIWRNLGHCHLWPPIPADD